MSRLVQLIQHLQAILGHVSIRTILEVIDHLFRIGPPPALTDKAALHNWLQGLLPVLDTISEATPTDIDDQAVVLLRTALEDEEAWDALHGLLTVAWMVSEMTGVKSDGMRESNGMGTLVEKSSLEVHIIMEIIRMIMELIELLRK